MHTLQPLKLTCIEVRGTMSSGGLAKANDPTGEGATRPLRVIAQDANRTRYNVVLKLRQPMGKMGHYGATSLANELAFAVLARRLEVPVPDYAVVEVPAGLPQAVSQERIRLALQNNLGSNFGSVYQAGFAPWSFTGESHRFLAVFQEIFCLDATILNGDRQIPNPNLLWKGDELLCIDHGLSGPFGPNQGQNTLPLQTLKTHCCQSSLKRHGKALTPRLPDSWKTHLSSAHLATLRNWIPTNWERYPGDLDRLFEFIRTRLDHFGEIMMSMRSAVA